MRECVEKLENLQERCDELQAEFDRKLEEVRALACSWLLHGCSWWSHQLMPGAWRPLPIPLIAMIPLHGTQLRAEYETKKAPHYKARSQIVIGVPGFWLQVFQNNMILAEEVQTADEEVYEGSVLW